MVPGLDLNGEWSRGNCAEEQKMILLHQTIPLYSVWLRSLVGSKTIYDSQPAIHNLKDFHAAGIPYGAERASFVIGSTYIEDYCSIIDLNQAQQLFVDVLLLPVTFSCL
jgi:hypothetical protein